MEPGTNKQLAIRKAINAHEDAQGSLNDLKEQRPDAVHEEMLDRIAENLKALRAAVEMGEPEDLI